MTRFIPQGITRNLRNIPEVEEFIYDPKFDKDYAHLTSTEYTSMILGQLINSITHDLKFTTENQSEYDDNFLPTLDLN